MTVFEKCHQEFAWQEGGRGGDRGVIKCKLHVLHNLVLEKISRPHPVTITLLICSSTPAILYNSNGVFIYAFSLNWQQFMWVWNISSSRPLCLLIFWRSLQYLLVTVIQFLVNFINNLPFQHAGNNSHFWTIIHKTHTHTHTHTYTYKNITPEGHSLYVFTIQRCRFIYLDLFYYMEKQYP